MNDTKTVYVTKYALSAGIQEVEVRRSSVEGLVVSRRGMFFKDGSECFASREEALKDAEVRRKKKIMSLRKQIKKLEGVEFE